MPRERQTVVLQMFKRTRLLTSWRISDGDCFELLFECLAIGAFAKANSPAPSTATHISRSSRIFLRGHEQRAVTLTFQHASATSRRRDQRTRVWLVPLCSATCRPIIRRRNGR